MFRRILLALTFVAALGVAGLGMSKTADAWGGCHRGYYGGYGGGYGGYGYSTNYAPYGYGYYGGYAPSYRVYRRGYYAPYNPYYGGIQFSIGF